MGEMSKVEEVARAMIEELRRQAEENAGAVKGDSSDDVLIDGRGFDMKLVAKASIKAMRAPTEAMKEYAAFSDNISTSFGGDRNSFDYISEEDAGNIFDMMLDAALKE